MSTKHFEGGNKDIRLCKNDSVVTVIILDKGKYGI
jgi:hypothetical protein